MNLEGMLGVKHDAARGALPGAALELFVQMIAQRLFRAKVFSTLGTHWHIKNNNNLFATQQ